MDILQRLLAGHWHDPDTGRPVPLALRRVVIDSGVAASAERLIADLALGATCLIVGDARTDNILGHALAGRLRSQWVVERVQLPPAEGQGPKEAQVRAVAAQLQRYDFAIAVGSGSVNDTVKRAAFLANRPYVVFGTAPSMNGYVSGNATITTDDGRKQSLPARPPVAAFLDLDVLCAAPVRLIRAGIGDSLCRTTCQADWLLSHFLRGTVYRRGPFDLLAEDEPYLLQQTASLIRGDIGAMRVLARILILSGIGMTISDGSYPASQGEHLIAHYLDITAGPEDPWLYHGEAVSIATLTLRRLQDALLAGMPLVQPRPIDRAGLDRHFGAARAASYEEALRRKEIQTTVEANDLNRRIQQSWPSWRARLQDIMVPAAVLHRALRDAGVPCTYDDVGLSAARYHAAILSARLIRNRFGFLDLAALTGKLAAFADQETNR